MATEPVATIGRDGAVPAAGSSVPGTAEPTSEQMLAMLAILPQPQQDILRLRVREGLSAEQVAVKLNVKVGTVRAGQHRALSKLRHLVEEHVARNQQASDIDSTEMWHQFNKIDAVVEPRAVSTSGVAVDTSGVAVDRRLPLAQERTEFAIAAVGSAANLAKLLNVSRSQPTRWRKGDEVPSPGAARLLIDLDHVMARASMLFPQPVALDWLTSANSHLDGARPIDVLQSRGSTEVIEALDALLAGAFG